MCKICKPEVLKSSTQVRLMIIRNKKSRVIIDTFCNTRIKEDVHIHYHTNMKAATKIDSKIILFVNISGFKLEITFSFKVVYCLSCILCTTHEVIIVMRDYLKQLRKQLQTLGTKLSLTRFPAKKIKCFEWLIRTLVLVRRFLGAT